MLDNVSNFPLSITSRIFVQAIKQRQLCGFETNNKSRHPLTIRDPKEMGYNYQKMFLIVPETNHNWGFLFILVQARHKQQHSYSLQNPNTQTKHSLINLNTLINSNCKVNCWGCLDDYKLNKHAAASPDQSKRRAVSGAKYLPTDSFVFTRIHPAARTYKKYLSSLRIST